jgi:hypothetical protein
VLVSFAHESAEHEDLVREFWLFLREQRIDARIDLTAGEQRQDWPRWMEEQIAAADFVVVVASPEYRRRAGTDPPADRGLGVRWEGRMLRDRVYRDPDGALKWVVPVVLPGRSAEEIPGFLVPISETYFAVSEFTVAGAEKLLRFLPGAVVAMTAPSGRSGVGSAAWRVCAAAHVVSRATARAAGRSRSRTAMEGRAAMCSATPWRVRSTSRGCCRARPRPWPCRRG